MSWSIDIDPALAPLVPLVVGSALTTAIDRFVGAPTTGLKWPNDILVPAHDERKLVGILAEAVVIPRATGAAERMRVVAGMGTNIDLGLEREDVPDEVRARAVDLATLLRSAAAVGDQPAKTVDRAMLVDAMLDACDDRLDELERSAEAALATYRSRCLTIGRTVRFETASGDVEGVAVDVGDDGALVVETIEGDTRRLTAGDAHHIG